MTAAAILSDEIRRLGPIPFRRFMEVALYHPSAGYYRKPRDPFGREGDFYTAEQLQPVFGMLIARRVRQFWDELGRPSDFTVVELGAGRSEMADAFRDFRYVPLETSQGELPSRFQGVVFSNEFFDALPVHAAVRRGTEFRELLVGNHGAGFEWIEGPPVSAKLAAYLARYAGALPDGARTEINLDALDWMDRIGRCLERGFVLTVDYGYTARELATYPSGSLMSYHRHVAFEDVLTGPGERDITAHVCYTALEDRGRATGLVPFRFENLSRTLADAGEVDGFAQVLDAASESERLRRRGQLKSLLFDFGERFRTLIQRKAEHQ